MKLESLKDVKYQEVSKAKMKLITGGADPHSWGPYNPNTNACTTGYRHSFLGITWGTTGTDSGDEGMQANSESLK